MAITTNKEYLTAVLSRFGASENDIDVILIDNSLTGTATVDAPACKKAMYNSMTSILRAGSVSEGGYSMSWDIEAAKSLKAEGLTYKQIGERFGVTGVAIWSAFRHRGLTRKNKTRTA